MKYGFIFVALAILLSFCGYVIARGAQALPSAGNIRPIFLGLMIALFAIMIGSLIIGEALPPTLAKVLSFAGFSFLILAVYLFFSFLLVDIVRISNYFLHFAPVGMAGFRLWTMIASVLIIGVAMGIGNYKFNNPAVVTLDLSIDKPLQNKEIKIVAVSDLHLGISIDKKRLKSYVELINAQKPDIVLIAGDVSDHSSKPLIRQNMGEELRAIKAPMGVYAISGNHEYFSANPAATWDYLRKSGIIVLRDSVALVANSFYIVGRDDRTNRQRKDLTEIVKGMDDSKPRILLDHQPYYLEEAEQNGIDLQISGHTHNGQIFPGNLIVKNMYELGYGYLRKGKTHYYVSSGLGLWGPEYRIGTQSELVVIKLKI